MTIVINKFNAALKEFKAKIEQLNQNQGEEIKFTQREVPNQGFKNVTVTDYTQPFEVQIGLLRKFGFEIPLHFKDSDKIKIKIRIRAYGEVPESSLSINLNSLTKSKITQGRRFVELKSQNPEIDLAGLKPQALIEDAHIALLGTPEFLNKFDEILATSTDEAHLDPFKNGKKLPQEQVVGILNFLKYITEKKLNTEIVGTNSYSRQAYSLKIKSATSGKIYDLQSTFDTMVSFQISEKVKRAAQLDKAIWSAYNPEDVVCEFKIPAELKPLISDLQSQARLYNQFSDSKLPEGYLYMTQLKRKTLDADLPGITAYFDMINLIIMNRDYSKPLNRGKWGLTIKFIADHVE